MKVKILTVLLGAALGFAANSHASQSKIPAFAPEAPIPQLNLSEYKLKNGMTVWVLPRNGVPRVDFVLSFRNAGNIADGADQAGLADMLAGMLTEGTQLRNSKAIAESAQSYGGGVSARAGLDGLSINAYALASNAESMAKLMAEIARQPSFPESELTLAKTNALQGLKLAKAQPGYQARLVMDKNLYGAHPYGNTNADEKAINAVNRQLLQSEHAKRFRPDQALLIITGRISAKKAHSLAKKAFADWTVTGSNNNTTISVAPNKSTPIRVLVQRPNSVQSALRLGSVSIPTKHADYIPLRLANTVIGSGFSSRINQNLREDKGYTYGARVSLNTYAHGGILTGSSDVRNEVTGAALKEFIYEYQRMTTELVPEVELDRTKRYMAGGYLLSNQQQAAVAGTLAGYWLDGLPASAMSEYVTKIREVTAEQVKAVSAKYFQAKDQSIVVVGDKAVAEQLKAFGDFEQRPMAE